MSDRTDALGPITVEGERYFHETVVSHLVARACEEQARRLAELEAALEEIEDGTTSDRIGQYSALRDWVNRTARGALDGDGGGA